MFEKSEDRVFAIKTLRLTQKEIESAFVESNGMKHFDYFWAS